MFIMIIVIEIEIVRVIVIVIEERRRRGGCRDVPGGGPRRRGPSIDRWIYIYI